jgi:hypothetical protein
MVAGYLGSGSAFVYAVTEFAVDYADQTERDYRVLLRAIRAGKLEAFIEN